MVGIVVVSHSAELARGLSRLARQMAGPDVKIEAAGGIGEDELGTDEQRVRGAIVRAESGEGVAVLADLGSAILTVRHLLESFPDSSTRLVDAPLVEGAVAAAVSSSAGSVLAEVVRAAEDARGAEKL